MGRPTKNLVGIVFGRLMVSEGPKYLKIGGCNRSHWLAQCTCGLTSPKWYLGMSLLAGNTRSCGCLQPQLLRETNTIVKKKENEYEIIVCDKKSFVMVLLTKGVWATCDVEDWFDTLIHYKWHAVYNKGTKSYYARSNVINSKKLNKVTISMHRKILGITDDKIIVDHVNHSTVENCKSNLRVASKIQNSHNSRIRKNNSSGFIGVSLNNTHSAWSSSIRYQGKRIALGYFIDKRDAAVKRDLAALYLRKEFAVLNFPDRLAEYKKVLELGKPF